jgi:peptidoglycan lytic transglycosylase
MSGCARAALLSVLLAVAGCRSLGGREATLPPGARPPAGTVVPAAEPAPAAPAAAPAARPSDAELRVLPDAVPRAEPRARLGNPAFYEVFGQRYVVLADSRGYLERGVASWYGPDFHGERTSTGEPYDMYTMTAAHRTLPLPAYVRVTNLRNSRVVVVRVNDRGPFKSNRIIDLSYAAALRLDMIRDGTTLVEVEAIGTEATPPPPPPPSQLFTQAGAFAVEANAQRLRDRLSAGGIDKVELTTDSSGSSTWYRVRIGPINSVAAFDALIARLKALGIANATLVAN